jgi:hypothetical protein
LVALTNEGKGLSIPDRVSSDGAFVATLRSYANTSKFEENNTKIADIGLVQALMLVQDVGLWSGNRRKMEIAECRMLIYALL